MHRDRLYAAFTSTDSKEGRRHGNLYRNIPAMMDFAWEKGFRYLFMLQDDMQFVRPLSANVCGEYSRLFDEDELVIQVDPRFFRNFDYQTLPEKRAYRHGPATSYADVGITDLKRLRDTGWRMIEGERANAQQLAQLGCKRLFPFTPIVMHAFTPIVMHVPFPKLYRQGKRRFRGFPFNRGRYGWHDMTAAEIEAMDARPLEELPMFRRFLRPKNMKISRILYAHRKDGSIFT